MLQLKNITKTYVTDHFTQNALDDVTINFEKGMFTAILGESGSGKSTLLNIVSGLDKPTKGEIYLDGIDLSNLSKKKWAVYRNHYVGFIFQEYNLIKHLKIVDNVAMPLLLQGVSASEAHKRAMEKLEMLDLVKHANKLPNQLSGGQQQRVSIARALVTDPKIIMADEPTGALDEAMGKKVLQFIKKSCPDKIIIMVTHDEELANEFADRIIRLSDGKVIDDNKVVESRLDANDSMSFKKPKMPLGMEFKFSLNNLLSRMGRTIFTSLTVAIGLISIFLLVFLMTGVNKTINSVVDELLPENVYSITKDTNIQITETDLNEIKNLNYVDEVLYDISIPTYGSYLSHNYQLTIYNLPEHKNNFIGNKSLRGSYVLDVNDAIITTSLLSDIRGEAITSSNIESNFNIVKDDYIEVKYYGEIYYLKIVGLVESSNSTVYVSNEKAIEIASDNDYKMNANIYFNTTDKNKIDKIITELEDNNYIVSNISVEIKEAMDNFFGRAKKILVSVASVSLIVAGILVGLIVYTSVIERIKEIGILTAIGAKPSNIMQIFIFESGLIGLFSVIIAFLMSLLFSLLGNKIFGSMLTSLINVLGFSTRANIFRVDIIWTILVFILCVVFTSLVGIIPAYKASRVNAINTLRKE